jgi:hypothetical protein
MSKSLPDDTVVHAVAVDSAQFHVEAVAAEPSAPVNPNYVPQQQDQQTAVDLFQNEGGAREFLSSQGFPPGLQDCFVDSLKKLPLRFFILDDSGSMATNDGKRIVISQGKKA